MRVDGGFLKNGSVSQDKLAQPLHRLANVAAMTAIEDAADGTLVLVEGVGLYVFDDDSTESTSAPLVYEPDAGDGAWLAVALEGDYLHEHDNKSFLDDLSAAAVAIGNAPLTVVDMAGAAHAIVIGTAGVGETELTNRTVLCDAGGLAAALTLPAVADFEGFLIITNIGGEDVSVVAPAGTILPGTTALFTSDGTAWRRVLTDALDAFFDDTILSLGANTVQEALDALGAAAQAMTFPMAFNVVPAAAGANDFHARVTGSGAVLNITTAFATVYPARNLSVDASADYDGGALTFVGEDLAGNEITEEITPNPGGTVVGTKAFKTITSMTSASAAVGGSTIDVGTGAGFAVAAPCGTLDVLAADGTVDGSAALEDADTGLLSVTTDPNGTHIYTGQIQVALAN